MALKRLKLKLAQPAPTETGDSIPVIAIDGDLIKQYNDADTQAKQAAGVMEELRPDISEIGLNEIFTRSCRRPATPTCSVKLQDDAGEVLLVMFVNKYKDVADVPAAEELFENHDLDINGYVTEGVKATFDDKVFYDADGNFVQEIYDDVRKAIQTIVAKRGLAKNPLDTTKIVKTKPCFHAERFALFPKVETQHQVFTTLPNTLSFKPVRPDAKKKK